MKSLSLKDLYKKQKEIINKANANEYPTQINESECENFKIIKHLIDINILSGHYFQPMSAPAIIVDIKTTINHISYLEEINNELRSRNIFLKIIKYIWVILKSIPKIVYWIILFLIAIITLLNLL